MIRIKLSNLKKRQYLAHYWLDNGFKGIVVNQELPFFAFQGSFEIALCSPFPLNKKRCL